MGQSTSFRFLPSCGAFSASFILLPNSSSVSSMSSKPSGGGLRLRDDRTAGIVYVGGCMCGVGALESLVLSFSRVTMRQGLVLCSEMMVCLFHAQRVLKGN